MKASLKVISSFITLFFVAILLSSFQKENKADEKFPYQQAGLTERQAAAHLLSRFTYGARKGEVDAVLKMGLEKWFQQQLDGDIKDEALNKMLSKYEDINLTNSEVEDKFPRNATIVSRAIKAGIINKDDINSKDKNQHRQEIADYLKKNGLKAPRELYRQFISQKILRATYTNNQLKEVLTDFWFNHFNVSLNKNQCAPYVPAYERDVIRPNVTGQFDKLLIATAKSPAMLFYLDNFISSGQPKLLEAKTGIKVKPANKKMNGLNENYAREIMELHTLGVDGGYTQSDVTQAARVLTGWAVAPLGEDGYGAAMKEAIEKERKDNNGLVQDGDFLFLPSRHDDGEKTVLGKRFPAGGEYEEGVTMLTMLARHPATAKFISKKLAIRFVNDQPSQKLIDDMARTFSNTNGDIKKVMTTMVVSPEFWSTTALRDKTKSPFELAISAVRSLEANISQPYQLFAWLNKMGQKIYYYQAPTGFPDRGPYWINTGSLLNRMNFGLALAAQRIPGIIINLAALNDQPEPPSADAALITYGKIIMPERDLNETVKRLKPMLTEPELQRKVAKAAENAPVPASSNTMNNDEDDEENVPKSQETMKKETADMLAQVVGVIIGSPEFQRR